MALERDPDDALSAVFRDINELTVYVAYPFFLKLYEDYDRGILQRDEFVEIVRLVESYVVRRAICGIPTNSLNRTFQTLGREMDRENYLGSAKAAFLLMESYRRFPTDEEFKHEFAQRDIYTLTNRRNYILRKLENFDSREIVRVQECTIEHIMPQNEQLPAAWRSDLGPEWKRIRDTYLHTIGNLTLTLYNPELSDRPFQQKRDMKGGFKDSKLRLAHDLANLERWTEQEIVDRAERLSNLALRVWPTPALPATVIDRYRSKAKAGASAAAEYTLSDHPHLTGAMLDLFELLRSRVLELDPSVTEDILKLYIAYKTTTNFVDVVPQKRRLRLSLNLEFEEIDDPRGWCKDVSEVGRWGNGDVEVGLSSPDQLDYIMFLIGQSFVRHTEIVSV
jgi:predicted transport protein